MREEDLLEALHPDGIDKKNLQKILVELSALKNDDLLTSVPGLTLGEASMARFVRWQSA